MAVSTIPPQLSSPTVGTGTEAGWVYSFVGGLFVGAYSGTATVTLTESSSLSKTGFYVSDRIDVKLPASLSFNSGYANIVTNVYDADLSRLTPYPSAANLRTPTTIGLRITCPKSINSVNLTFSIVAIGKVEQAAA